jgi:hypothetical protein
MKHIAFFKLGKSIKFRGRFSPTGGDNEAPSLLRLLANNNPDKVFHLTGQSDFNRLSEHERLELFPYDNVVNMYDAKAGLHHVHEYYQKVGQPDLVICIPGPLGTITIPDRIKMVKGDDIASVIDMTRMYVSPIMFWLNEMKDRLRLVEIINDPRYTLAGQSTRDIMINAEVSLSQYDGTYKKKCIRSYDDQSLVWTTHAMRYAEMEKIFLYDNPVKDVDIAARTVPFVTVLNEGRPSRYKFLKEWVLDVFPVSDVYGQWTDDIMHSNASFRGPLDFYKLRQALSNARSTVVIPIAKGWVTSKYIEMIHAGVVPFFHPHYDEQNHLDVPSYLRVSTPQILMERVNRVATDDAFYMSLIASLRARFITDDYTNGRRLSSLIFSAADPNYSLPDLNKFAVASPSSSSLATFF